MELKYSDAATVLGELHSKELSGRISQRRHVSLDLNDKKELITQRQR